MQQFRDYEVIEKIGEGGMGEVFRAKHRLRGFDVALKVIHAQLAKKDEARERFLSEARLLDRLDHPNILALRDYFLEDDSLVIIADLLEGKTLDEVIVGGAELPVEIRLDWLRQTIAGISHAHSLDIIHRDLKPSNLFLTRDGQIKILDFGLGKDLSADAQMTGTGQILGTPAYLPPETYRIENKIAIRDVGKKGDVFAVGVIAYRLLSGCLPFDMDEGLSATEVFTLLAVNYNTGKTIAPMTSDGKHITAQIADAVMHCLALNPNERPELLQSLADALMTGADDTSKETSTLAEGMTDQNGNSISGLNTYFEVAQAPRPGSGDKSASTVVDSAAMPKETTNSSVPLSVAPNRPQLKKPFIIVISIAILSVLSFWVFPLINSSNNHNVADSAFDSDMPEPLDTAAQSNESAIPQDTSDSKHSVVKKEKDKMDTSTLEVSDNSTSTKLLEIKEKLSAAEMALNESRKKLKAAKEESKSTQSAYNAAVSESNANEEKLKWLQALASNEGAKEAQLREAKRIFGLSEDALKELEEKQPTTAAEKRDVEESIIAQKAFVRKKRSAMREIEAFDETLARTKKRSKRLPAKKFEKMQAHQEAVNAVKEEERVIVDLEKEIETLTAQVDELEEQL